MSEGVNFTCICMPPYIGDGFTCTSKCVLSNSSECVYLSTQLANTGLKWELSLCTSSESRIP